MNLKVNDEPHHHDRGSSNKALSIQERVESIFYSWGLLCSNHPTAVLIFTAIVIISCCVPLVNIPLPLTFPQQEWLPTANVTSASPYCYVQQVILKAAVVPWENENLRLADAFRAPLYEAFKVLDIVRNYVDKNSLQTLGHVCLHVEAVSKHARILPEYSCLVLSPANFWHQDINEFTQDNSILSTIFGYHKYQKGKVSISEMLFGLTMRDTGIKRYPFRSRQRVIQFAVTLFYKKFDKMFIKGLHDKLVSIYPLHQDNTKDMTTSHLDNDTLIINYPGEIDYVELVPISIAFILLFLYYYFCVRKVGEIKTKCGMAAIATFTVFCSLLMTISICFVFGLTVNNQRGKWVFPYLAILWGLENVLVLTKSVLMTPLHLDAKIRLAQGLSHEAWSTTKNLLVEITILTFGLITFIPVVQEFCIFALVSLSTGLFIQIFFFITVLGIELNKGNHSPLEPTSRHFRNNRYNQPLVILESSYVSSGPSHGMIRSRSHPRLNFPANVIAATTQKHNAKNAQEHAMCKRLKIINIWTKTRFFQKSFMILMVLWISLIIYNSDIINTYFLNGKNDRETNQSTTTTSSLVDNYISLNFHSLPQMNQSMISSYYVTNSPVDVENNNHSHYLEKLKPSEYSPWLKLSLSHWSIILNKYNISLSGKRIALLPSIRLAYAVTPKQAALLSNPNEKYGEKFQWQALAVALDPIDFTGDDEFPTIVNQVDQPFYPRSPMEIMLITILITISIIVLGYAFVVLYTCICSKNYAEWRSSWYPENNEEPVEDHVLLEAMPVVLQGHQQEIECLATDGANLVSVCLAGQVRVWDSITGELFNVIDRRHYFSCSENDDDLLIDMNGLDYTDSDDSSPVLQLRPLQFPMNTAESYPKLMKRINIEFSGFKSQENEEYNAQVEFERSFKYHYTSAAILNKTTYVNNNNIEDEGEDRKLSSKLKSNRISSVWCIDYVDNLIFIGCANGRLEIWEANTTRIKCILEGEKDSGITHIKVIGSSIILARLHGSLDLLQLQTFNQGGKAVDWTFTRAYQRTHIRTGSMGSISEHTRKSLDNYNDDLKCIKVFSVKAHQQPITCLDCEGGRIVSGSQDHKIKVYRMDNGEPLYTLHGHCGPITCLFIDRVCTATSGSGSQDGMLCVWDLLSGTCMYSIQAHDGAIVSLTYSASYVISLGADERLCVWERFQGHMLKSIFIGAGFSNNILMLAPHLVVAGKNGRLVIWDVRTGGCVRNIPLGRDPLVFTNQLVLLRDAVLCDYGKELRIVQFPLITHKFD